MKRCAAAMAVAIFVLSLTCGRASGAPAHPSLAAVRAALGTVHTFDRVAVSPDGARVAWAESVVTRRAGADVRHETIAVALTAHPAAVRRITACPGAACDEGSFAWSPEGTQLAFLTTAADGQAQLALADVRTGAVRRLTTDARGPLADPKWSPNGDRIAVLYTKNGPKAPGPLNPTARDAGVLGQTFFEQRIALTTPAGAPLRAVSPADLYVYEYDWSPDGSMFAATGAHGSGDDNWWIADLYAIAARDGTTKKLHHPELQIASPRWSGDGRRIAYIGGLMSDEAITGGDVYVLPAAGGAAEDVTPGLNASVTTIAWNGSPNRLLVTELAGGEMAVATVDADTKTHARIWHAAETVEANSLGGFAPGDAGVSVARDGVTSAVIRESFTRAPEIYVGGIGAWRPVTARNASTPQVIKEARSLTWTSDGLHVQGWLVSPDGYTPGRRYPLVVVVHGGPAFANYPHFPSGPAALDAYLASQGYFVLEPNPRGSYGGGEAFTRANVKDFGGGDLRDILAGVDAAEAAAPIDDARVGVCGWSYGGYMTMWAVTQTRRFHAAVSGAGLSDWLSYYGTNDINTWMLPYFGASVYDDPDVYAKSAPLTYIKQARTPTLLVGGDRDAEVPITQSYEYWHALKTLGVPTEFVVYPDEGHEFHAVADQVDVARRLVGWFDRWLR